MNQPSLLAAILLLGATLVTRAQESEWSGTCKVQFSGESTLHDFEGSVSAEPFTVTISDMSDPAKATATSSVVVKAAGMDTGNDKRDVEMHKCMDVATHPEIVVEIDHLAVAATKPAADGAVPRPTIIPFQMTLKGKTHEVTGQVSDWSYSEKEASFTVSFPVSLKDSGITPPNVLGLVKVKDEILVSASVKLTRK
jgi:YceI-like domain